MFNAAVLLRDHGTYCRCSTRVNRWVRCLDPRWYDARAR